MIKNGKIKTLTMLLSLFLVITMVFSACSPATNGGSDSSKDDASSKTEDKGEDKPSTATGTIGDNLKYDLGEQVNGGKDIKIEFWIQNELKDVYEEWIKKYTELHPNVKVNPTYAANKDHFQKLPVALQSGTGPDIFHMHNSHNAAIIPNAAPYPEDILPIEELKKDFIQVEEHVIDGKLYYIDMGLMTSGIFYNTDMWAEAGLTEADIPKTWEDFTTVAKKLTKTDASGVITQEGFAINGAAHLLLGTLNMQKGNFMFDESGKAIVNTPDMKSSMEYINGLYNTEKVSSIKFSPNSESFANQQAAMVFNWGWYGSWLAQDSYKDLKWDFFVMPTVDGETPPAYDRNNGESTASVSAKAKDENKAVAFDMIKFFLCSDDLLVKADLLLSTAPTKLSLVDNAEIKANKVLGAQSPILERTYWPGAIPDPYFQGLNKYIEEDVLLNGVSIDNALVKAEEMINKDLASLPFSPTERLYKYASDFK